jgi:hypothetical protein
MEIQTTYENPGARSTNANGLVVVVDAIALASLALSYPP